MAQRRMFSKEVTESDAFIDMPLSSQALYFHLGISADDDWFVSPQRILRAINANKNDLDILLLKGFCIAFDDWVLVITHWRQNNYLRPDRYTPTQYQKHIKTLQLDGSIYVRYTTGIPLVGVGKDSIGKISKEEEEQKKIIQAVMDNLQELDWVENKFPLIDMKWLELEIPKMLDWSKNKKKEIKNWKNFVDNRLTNKQTKEKTYQKDPIKEKEERIRKQNAERWK